MFWAYFKWLLLEWWNKRSFFSFFHCENVAGILEVKLRSMRAPLAWASLGILALKLVDTKSQLWFPVSTCLSLQFRGQQFPCEFSLWLQLFDESKNDFLTFYLAVWWCGDVSVLYVPDQKPEGSPPHTCLIVSYPPLVRLPVMQSEVVSRWGWKLCSSKEADPGPKDSFVPNNEYISIVRSLSHSIIQLPLSQQPYLDKVNIFSILYLSYWIKGSTHSKTSKKIKTRK